MPARTRPSVTVSRECSQYQCTITPRACTRSRAKPLVMYADSACDDTRPRDRARRHAWLATPVRPTRTTRRLSVACVDSVSVRPCHAPVLVVGRSPRHVHRLTHTRIRQRDPCVWHRRVCECGSGGDAASTLDWKQEMRTEGRNGALASGGRSTETFLLESGPRQGTGIANRRVCRRFQSSENSCGLPFSFRVSNRASTRRRHHSRTPAHAGAKRATPARIHV
jgi:hypothetical protein